MRRLIPLFVLTGLSPHAPEHRCDFANVGWYRLQRTQVLLGMQKEHCFYILPMYSPQLFHTT